MSEMQSLLSEYGGGDPDTLRLSTASLEAQKRVEAYIRSFDGRPWGGFHVTRKVVRFTEDDGMGTIAKAELEERGGREVWCVYGERHPRAAAGQKRAVVGRYQRLQDAVDHAIGVVAEQE